MKKNRMNKIWVSVFLITLSIVALPIIHIVRIKVNESDKTPEITAGYRNDASHLNATKVYKIIEAKSEPNEIKEQLQDLLKYAQKNNLKVSLSGAKHSMGGHTIYPNGISINMLPYNHMAFNAETNILTIGSGATWSQALHHLDKYGKSIAVMQSFSNFSIGGSISVNGHGWQKNASPISESIESFTLMKANGEIVNCSRTENSELFKLAIGGYGLFGIILDVNVHVVDNVALKFHSKTLEPQNYEEKYQQYVSQNDKAQFAYGRVRISEKNFMEQLTLNYFEKTTDQPLVLKEQKSKNAEIKRLVFRGSINNEYGKRLRWDLEQSLNRVSPYTTFSRNEILDEDSSLIENKDPNSTDILHEYFVPKDQLEHFLADIKPILLESNVDLLNITIREVLKDDDAYLNYAREDVFGLVFLFNQQKTEQQEREMALLTNQLVDTALKNKGTFYLPYRLHVDKTKMRQVYPQANQFFALKLKYDPKETFSNEFYKHYK